MRRVLAIALIGLAATCGFSQIVITAADLPSGSDTLRFSNVALNSLGNYQQSGPAYNWDFSQLSLNSEGIRNYMPASLTPYFFFFLAPNEYGEKLADTLLGTGPVTLTRYYNYYRKTTSPLNAFVADGVGLTFSTIPLPSYYTDKDELYIFPLNYGDRDSSTFRFSTPSVSVVPIRYSKTGHRITEVDGWGTITTPYGTQNCLRIVTTQYAKDSIKNNIIPFPFGYTNNVRSYQWLVPGGKMPYFEVTGTLVGNTFTPTQARIRGYKVLNPVGVAGSRAAGLKIYPQPADDRLYIEGLQETARLSVCDMLGKVVVSSIADNRPAPAEVSLESLPAGVYILVITQGEDILRYKFTKG